jgi:RNA polymerase nonessential primary-like sigma factor
MTVPQTTKPDVAVAEELDTQGPSADLVRVYLNGIGRTALLTAQEEVDLAKRIEAGVFAKHLLETSRTSPPSGVRTSMPSCGMVGARRTT